MAAPCVVGVDLGGTKLLAGAVDANLNVHHRTRRAATGLDRDGLLDAAVSAVDELRETLDGPVAAVGFGIPCTIDQERGVAVQAVNLPLLDVPFRDLMAERLAVPVFVDNDANVAGLAEHRFGAARGARHSVTLTVGTGIGGGLVLDDAVYRGSVGAAAELGHMVVDADGPRCQGNCPNRGCLEAVASGTALAREARAAAERAPESALGRAMASGRAIAGALVTELAHDGDAVARSVLELIGSRLGVGVASYVNIFNPEFVVLGGGVMGAGELLLEPVRAEVAARALRPGRDLVQIVPARFGGEAGMIGAAALALDGLGAA
ncbi:MAG TPA: ROK family protein [Solirubrobacteraceae bacterium]|nr:ROK family protein [Solirubrobacteraceae bacterium]